MNNILVQYRDANNELKEIEALSVEFTYNSAKVYTGYKEFIDIKKDDLEYIL